MCRRNAAQSAMECRINSTFNESCGGHLQLLSSPAIDAVDVNVLLKWLFSRMRIFWYLSDPYEESFEFVHQVADYHTEAFPLLMAFVFTEWLILYLQGKSLPLLGDSSASVAMIVNMECARILCRGVEHTAYFYIYNHFRLFDLPWDSPYTWYLAAIFVDFCYYWGHRASHVINALWAHHQAHHSAESYTLINVFRLPFTQDWLYAFSYLPMALVVPPTHYLVHHQLNLLYQFWLHTDVVSNIGPLEWILNTPSHHRVHHGSNTYCLDKNFGAWLIIWDRMFGTFQEEITDVPIVYGLVDQVQSFNPIYLQVFYFGKIYDKWKSMVGWKNKIYSVIKGPGWRPGSPWTGFIEEVPDVSLRQTYIYTDKPTCLLVYLFIHWIIVLMTYQIVGMFRHRMSSWSVTGHLAYVVFTMTNVGMFIDDHPAAPTLEFARCAFTLVYSQGGLPILTDSLLWSGLTAVYGATLESSIYWLLRSYFLVSTLIWAWTSTCRSYELAPSKSKSMQISN